MICAFRGLSSELLPVNADASLVRRHVGHVLFDYSFLVILMKVLIACEFSGIVRDAFIRAGHNAVSCDLEPTESPGPHIQGDVLAVLDDHWDLLIAHPPCRFLSYAGNHVWNAPGRAANRNAAMSFFLQLFNAPIGRVCVENPFGYAFSSFRPPDQVVQPYYFGDSFVKKTCFWLRNLPCLEWYDQPGFWHCQTAVVRPEPVYVRGDGKSIYHIEAAKGSGDARRKARSRFFPGIAAAMADQWGHF